MSGTLRVEIDPTGVSLAETIAEAARHISFLVIGGRLFDDLAAELGGYDGATGHLLDVASATGKPIAVNVATGDGVSTTAVVAPRSWSQERLKGWMAGQHEALTELFGPSTIREDIS